MKELMGAGDFNGLEYSQKDLILNRHTFIDVHFVLLFSIA